MKRFAKLFPFGALAAFGTYHKYQWKAMALDDVAEGIELEKVRDDIAHDVSNLRLFSVTGQKDLANEVAYYLNTNLGKLQIRKPYEGSDSHIDILESVRSKVVYLICSFDTSRWSFNETFVDLLLTICAMKKSSVRKVNVILPYYIYTRQNNIEGENRSSSLFASDIALLLEAAGADKIFTVDLETSQLNGSFNIPIVEVDCNRLCASYYKDYDFSKLVVVCANDRLFPKAVKIQRKFRQEGLNTDIGIMVKVQDSTYDYIGKSVKDRDVLLIDNVVDTAKTIHHASKKLDDLGAKNIYMFAIHGVFSKGAIELIDESPVKELVITNTVPGDPSQMSPKINQVSVAKMLAETIAQSTFNRDVEQLKKDGVI